MTGRRDYTINRGNTLPMEAWFTVEGVTNPLAGSTAYFTLKRRLTDPDDSALVRKSTEETPPEGVGPIAGTLEAADDTAGTPARALFTWRLEPEDTASLGDGYLNRQLEWDCKYRAPDGNVLSLSGSLRLRPEVTKTL